MEISQTFTFDAAHHLTDYYGKCERPHGHTYRLTVTLSGPLQQNGLVCDFHLLKTVVEENVLRHLDHHDLNTLFKNPSAEHIAVWIFKKLKPLATLLKKKFIEDKFQKELARKYLDGKAKQSRINFSKIKLTEIRLCETENSCVIYP